MGTFARDTIKIMFGPAAVLAINFWFSHFVDIYSTVVWFDNLMHGFGGISIGVTAIVILQIAGRRNYIGEIHWLGKLLFALSFTALAAITWELYEFLSDKITGTTYQATVSDTMTDMALGLLGGFTSALCYTGLIAIVGIVKAREQ